MAILKKQLHRIISSNNVSSESSACILLKESFKEILLDLMGAEMDVALRYCKLQKSSIQSSNNVFHQ